VAAGQHTEDGKKNT